MEHWAVSTVKPVGPAGCHCHYLGNKNRLYQWIELEGKSWRYLVFPSLWRPGGSFWSVWPGEEEEEEVVTAHGGSVAARCISHQCGHQYQLSPLMLCCPGLALASFLLPLVSTTPFSYIQVISQGSRYLGEHKEGIFMFGIFVVGVKFALFRGIWGENSSFSIFLFLPPFSLWDFVFQIKHLILGRI